MHFSLVLREREEKKPKHFAPKCMSPHAKESLLKHQNISLGALSEPNINEKNILAGLNITIEQFFRKYTFKLNEDYYLYISFWSYEKEGWKENKTKLHLGQDNKIKVHIQGVPAISTHF